MARARRSASTGSPAPAAPARRALLKASALVPWAVASWSGSAAAAEYAGAREALDALDRMEAEVEACLRALSASLASARPFLGSALSDLSRQRGERASLRQRLRLAAASPPAASPAEPDLAALRSAQETLVYAHAEALPALGDPFAVRVLARHMVELARHLTVIDLWIEAEERRGAEPDRRQRRD